MTGLHVAETESSFEKIRDFELMRLWPLGRKCVTVAPLTREGENERGGEKRKTLFFGLKLQRFRKSLGWRRGRACRRAIATWKCCPFACSRVCADQPHWPGLQDPQHVVTACDSLWQTPVLYPL